jgi:hypothetical protein
MPGGEEDLADAAADEGTPGLAGEERVVSVTRESSREKLRLSGFARSLGAFERDENRQSLSGARGGR